MSETRYKVVFNGELVPGANLDATKESLASLFKTDRHKIEQLFGSPNVAIKRDLSEAEAQKYVDVLARAGIKTFAAIELASTLSLVQTDHAAPTNQKRMTCPKCQTEQVESPTCTSCGIVIEKYLARQEQLKTISTPTANGTSPFRPPQADVSNFTEAFGALSPFTIQGRIGRLRYLAWSLVLTFALAAIASIAFLINSTLGVIVTIPVMIAAMVIGVFIGGQRLHDIGWSAWLLLIFFVPFIGGFFTFVMMLMPGTQGANQYGPPPPPNSTGVIVLSVLYLVVIALSLVAAFTIPAAMMALR